VDSRVQIFRDRSAYFEPLLPVSKTVFKHLAASPRLKAKLHSIGFTNIPYISFFCSPSVDDNDIGFIIRVFRLSTSYSIAVKYES
jgi:hypothetical protein